MGFSISDLNPVTAVAKSLLGNTVGKVTDALMDKYLPPTMSEAERTQAKLEAREMGLREIEAESGVLEAINATMQAEAKSENWWTSGWRPYWGFISGTVYGIVGIILSVAIIKMAWANPDKLFSQLPLVIGAFASFFSIAGAVLGITAWHRGKKQRIEAGEK